MDLHYRQSERLKGTAALEPGRVAASASNLFLRVIV